MYFRIFALIFLVFSCNTVQKKGAGSTPQSVAPATEPVPSLPEGNNGIASGYPGDIGIDSDPAVILADDFESYNNELIFPGRWDDAYHKPNLRIATEPGNIFTGLKALEFKVPQTTNEVSNAVEKKIKPGLDSLFLRYYAKYDTLFNVTGSSHNGCSMTASYWDGPGSGPGIPADGYNKFCVNYEAIREETGIPNPGYLNVYIYHPGQRDIYGDHFFPTGVVIPFSERPGNFGPYFIPRADTIPLLGRWYCYELMVKANNPGKRDGRVAMWLDGKLVADFPNLRLRDTATLGIDRFTIELHIKHNKMGVAKKWIDNVVAATSYIGPLTR